MREQESATAASTPWWQLLLRTLLAPAPALAYLVLLLVLVPIVLRGPADPAEFRPSVDLLPPPVRLFADDGFRGENQDPAEPASIAVAAGQRSVSLELVTDLDRAELAMIPDAELLLMDGDDVLFATPAVGAIDSAGLARVYLPLDELTLGRRYRVVVRSRADAGAPLFEAAFRLARP